MKAILKQKTLRADVPTAAGNIYSAEELCRAVKVFKVERQNFYRLVCSGEDNNLDNVAAKVAVIEFDGEAVMIEIETLPVFTGENIANMLKKGCELAIVPTMLDILDDEIKFYRFNILLKEEAGFDVETIKLEIFE